MDSNILTEVSSAQFSELLTIFERRLPFSAMLYNVLQLILNKKNINAEFLYVQVNSSGQISNDETNLSAIDDNLLIIFVIQKFKYFQQDVIRFSMPKNSASALDEEVLGIIDQFVDWSLPHVFGDVPEEFVPKLIKLYENRAGNNSRRDVEIDPLGFYWMDINNGLKLKLNLNDSYEIKELNPESEAVIVDNFWSEKREGSLGLAKDSIQNVGSIGVYSREREETELVSWAVTSPVGSINMLHTKQEHRRKGLGELTLNSLVKLNAQNCLQSIAHVHDYNLPSVTVMKKVGLKLIFNMAWIAFPAIDGTGRDC